MTRATNQAIVSTAWQKSLRDRRASEATSNPAEGVDLDLSRAVVRRTCRDVAESIILRYEWLGTMGITNYYFGLFFGDLCGGVACFQIGSGGGAGGHQFKMFGVSRDALAYLARGACAWWTPKGSASKLISHALRVVRREFPNVEVAVAYADTEAGEIGTVYQACGWTCIGNGAKVVEFVSPEGRVYNIRAIWKFYETSRYRSFDDYSRFIESRGWKRQTSNPKIRYFRALRNEREIEQRMAKFAVPYPKRSASVV